MTKRYSVLSLSLLSLSLLSLSVLSLTAPATAQTLPAPIPSPAPTSAFEHIEDYSPTECTGQVSYTTDIAEVEERIAALSQNFSQAVESILSDTSLVDCAAVTGTLSDTTQNINYLHETKGVYKVVTSAEYTDFSEEDYLYTFDILGVRYIPFTAEMELDMVGSTMIRAIGGTCITDDPEYPYEADCTFAIADEDNSALSVGKLYYYF